MSYSNIITNYNELNNKITSKIEETKEKLRQERINKYKADVDFVISDLLQKAGRITVCTVLEYTGYLTILYINLCTKYYCISVRRKID